MNGGVRWRVAAALLVSASLATMTNAQSGGLDRPPDLSPGRTIPKPDSSPAAEEPAGDLPSSPDESTTVDHGTANRFAAEAARKRADEERRPSPSARRMSATLVFAIAALLGLVALARTLLRARKT